MNKSEIINSIIALEDENTLLRFENEGLKAQKALLEEPCHYDSAPQKSNILKALTALVDLNNVFENLEPSFLEEDGTLKLSLEDYIGRLHFNRYNYDAQIFSKYCSLDETVGFFKTELTELYQTELIKEQDTFALDHGKTTK